MSRNAFIPITAADVKRDIPALSRAALTSSVRHLDRILATGNCRSDEAPHAKNRLMQARESLASVVLSRRTRLAMAGFRVFFPAGCNLPAQIRPAA